LRAAAGIGTPFTHTTGNVAQLDARAAQAHDYCKSIKREGKQPRNIP